MIAAGTAPNDRSAQLARHMVNDQGKDYRVTAEQHAQGERQAHAQGHSRDRDAGQQVH